MRRRYWSYRKPLKWVGVWLTMYLNGFLWEKSYLEPNQHTKILLNFVNRSFWLRNRNTEKLVSVLNNFYRKVYTFHHRYHDLCYKLNRSHPLSSPSNSRTSSRNSWYTYPNIEFSVGNHVSGWTRSWGSHPSIFSIIGLYFSFETFFIIPRKSGYRTINVIESIVVISEVWTNIESIP